MRRPTRALLLHCLRLDVVEAGGAGSATLLSGILFSSLIGFAVAGIAAGEPAAAAAPLVFALLGLFALVDALGDVASAWLDPRDVGLLQTLPVDGAGYARARLAALSLPVAAKGLALLLPSACAALSDGEWRRAAAWCVAFLLFAGGLAACAVLLLLVLRRLWPSAQLRDALAWIRALLLVGATGAWLALPPALADGFANGASVAWLPSRWFAELALWLGGAATRPGLALAALAATAALFAALAATARGYRSLLESLAAAPAAPRRSGPRLLRRLFERACVAPDERPTFRLALRLLRRERSFRLQALPLLAYPLLFLAVGDEHDDGGLFALLFAQLPALVLALLALLLRFSDTPDGGFVLRWYGAWRGRALESGARKACWWTIALPMALLVTLLLARQRDVLFALGAGSIGLFASTVALLGGRAPLPELPFVEKFRGRIDSSGGGRVFGLLGLLLLVALAAWFALRRGIAAPPIVAFTALTWTLLLLRRRTRDAGVAAEAVAAVVGDLAAYAPGDAPVPAARRVAAVPFPLRLARELRGMAAYFVLSGAVLTAFYAWQ